MRKKINLPKSRPEHRGIVVALVFAGLGLCSCGESETPVSAPKEAAAVKPLPRVLDRFEVGKNVYVRALTIEPEAKALWVGTSVGVHEIDLTSHAVRQTFTREHGLANEYVFAVGIDKNNNKWFGTNAGGVSRYKDGDWKTFFPLHGLADYWVYSFANQGDGTLWIGTWAGVNRVDPQTGEFTTYVRELVNEWVYGIGVDSRDRVWFGTEGGITRYDGKEWVSWTHEDGLGAPNAQGLPASKNTGLGTRSRHDLGVLSGGEATYNPNYVFAVLLDKNDELWAGTWGGGVAHFDGKTWTNYTDADGLAGNIVYAAQQGPDGVYWFGTNRGLSRYDGQNWQTYGAHEGLGNLDVYAIAVQDQGDIWAGTREAVVRIGLKTSGEQ
ncbi:MAG: hypothetical protein KDH88_12185 [Chromatiales bacterium]|nr:hypothetical protein [Chromatiales bacterium]